MSSHGKTCITCAKAKIKCDKMQPRCGRCVRLNIDCCAQLRGRGRPPTKPEKEEKGRNSNTKGFVSKAPKGKSLILVESLKASLQNAASKGLKGVSLDKCIAVVRWLLDVACCSKSEYMYDSIISTGEVFILVSLSICFIIAVIIEYVKCPLFFYKYF
jgi:hypothetical protein